MASTQEQVVAALRRFYDAIEDMISGRGTEAMRSAWHHTYDATGKHPSGEWSHGWEEVWTTWELYGSFGRPGHGGSKVDKITPVVHGDIAFTTAVFQASPAWGGERIMCTNILRRIDGEWKIIHHHADASPAMGAVLEKLASGG